MRRKPTTAPVPVGTRPQPPANEGGFALVESVVAMTLFAAMALIFAVTASSALRTYQVSRVRTVGEELATGRLEDARRMPYEDLGIVGGNPPGTIAATSTATVGALQFTVTTTVEYVDDPIPGGLQSAANYKRVVVSVDSGGMRAVTLETFVAPPDEAARGKGVMRVQVVDVALNQPVSGASVALAGGPSAARSDTTRDSGSVVFPDLSPNPASGSTAWYSLTVTKVGYQVLPEDASPSTASRTQLSAGETFATVIRVYKPVTIDVKVVDEAGNAFTAASTLEVSSTRGAASLALPAGGARLTSVGSDPVVPGVSYSLAARATGFVSAVVTKTVPDAYPTNLLSTFTLVMRPATTAKLQVQVRDQTTNSPLSGVRVLAQGGPLNTLIGADTNSGGVAALDVPAGASPSYTVSARPPTGYAAAQATTVVSGPGTTTVQLKLPQATS